MKIKFTPSAAKHIAAKIKEKSGAIGFRLRVKETGCSGYMYMPEIITSINLEDVHSVSENIDIYIDKDAVEILNGTTIDYVKRGLGLEQLEFNNPNVEGLCGCGESFKLKENNSD